MAAYDILLLESHHGTGARQAEALRAAGHRVHLCHDPRRFDFPCVAVTDSDGCPLERGVDVALSVRRGVAPKPTALEQGATCAIRRGVPLIEDGPTVLDPFAPYLTMRVRGSAVEACDAAVKLDQHRIRTDIRAAVAPALERAGVDAQDFWCEFDRDRTHLRVAIEIPEAEGKVLETVAVRTVDVLRDRLPRFDQFDVTIATPHLDEE